MSTTLSKSRSGTGFTLVELLVVIGIIAVLVALLLPALQKAKDQANAVKCANNMKQLITAFATFAHDNKGHLPGNRDNYAEREEWKRCFLFGGFVWSSNFDKAPQSGTIWKYIRNYDVYRCPSLQGNYASVGSGVMTNSRFDVAVYAIWRGAKLVKIKPRSEFRGGPSGRGKGWYITPIIVQETPNNMNSASWKEGNHSESDAIERAHNKGGWYGAVDGSVQHFISPTDGDSTHWWTEAPSGIMVQMGKDHPRTNQFGVFNTM
jgi:prepilin-type N-terminal cleavage/methylation domain-containing protein